MGPADVASSPALTVFFCHGSRSPDWRRPFEQLACDYGERFAGARTRLAFLELMSPDLPQVLAEEAAAGTIAVRIVPLFLAPGAHTSRDLPALVADAQRKWPQLSIIVEPTLLESAPLRAAIAASLGAAAGPSAGSSAGSSADVSASPSAGSYKPSL